MVEPPTEVREEEEVEVEVRGVGILRKEGSEESGEIGGGRGGGTGIFLASTSSWYLRMTCHMRPMMRV